MAKEMQVQKETFERQIAENDTELELLTQENDRLAKELDVERGQKKELLKRATGDKDFEDLKKRVNELASELAKSEKERLALEKQLKGALAKQTTSAIPARPMTSRNKFSRKAQQKLDELHMTGMHPDEYLAMLIDDYEGQLLHAQNYTNELLSLREAERMSMKDEMEEMKRGFTGQLDHIYNDKKTQEVFAEEKNTVLQKKLVEANAMLEAQRAQIELFKSQLKVYTERSSRYIMDQ